LLVEDDRDVADVVELLLQRAGFTVTVARDGTSGLHEAMGGRHELVLLDVLLPDLDGFQVCRELRRVTDVPIVMLTARSGTSDVVAGLELGADDYVVKPFEGPELLARVRAVLRRRAPSRDDQAVGVGPFRLDPDAFKAWKDGEELALTATEFRLLHELLRNRGRVLTRDALLRSVWGYEYAGDTRLVDTAILRLRDKVEDDPSAPRHITTVRGVGYRFEP
ncbi:MAG: winged helix-turn-helix domain-containing protein, partial [Actinomycetota bacterium]